MPENKRSDFELVVPEEHRKNILELIHSHNAIRDKYEDGSIFVKWYIQNIVFSHILSLTEAEIEKAPVEMTEDRMLTHIDSVHRAFTMPILKLINTYNDLLAKDPDARHLDVEVEEIMPKEMWLGDYHFAGVYMLTVVSAGDTLKVVFINAVKQGDDGGILRESVVYGGTPAAIKTMMPESRKITADEIKAIWG